MVKKNLIILIPLKCKSNSKFYITNRLQSSIPQINSEANIMSKQSTKQHGEIDTLALKYAKAFMSKEGRLARRFSRRGSLKQLYEDTTMAWMTDELRGHGDRPDFGKVLFAMAHGMKVLRVVRNGQELLWNRYRDNNGEQIEFDERRHNNRGRRDDRRRDDRDRRDDYDRRDDRGRRDDRDRRDNRDRYERRSNGRYQDDDRRRSNGHNQGRERW